MVKGLLSLICLLVLPFTLTGCLLKRPAVKPTTPSPEPSLVSAGSQSVQVAGLNYLTADPATLAASLKANRDLADEKVKAWQADAELYHVSAKLPPNIALGQATEVYSYGSKNDVYNWWTLNWSGKSGKSVRALIPKEDYLGSELKPIPRQFWKLDYIEAIQLADAAGGADYRARNGDSQIAASLAVGEPKGYLWWTVEYQSSTSDAWRILINPATKELFDQQGEPIKVGATSTITPSGEASPTAKPKSISSASGE